MQVDRLGLIFIKSEIWNNISEILNVTEHQLSLKPRADFEDEQESR